MGADSVILSNHGGRQLDATVPPLLVLPEAAKAKGSMAYAAALAGQAGAAHAIGLLRDEIHRDMALLGVKGLEDLGEGQLIAV